MSKVNREEFLRAVERCQPGLDPKGAMEQSACFNFKDGNVVTFNRMVWCRNVSTLPKEITASVTAKRLLEVLRKLSDEFVEVKVKGGHLLIESSQDDVGFKTPAEVTLPLWLEQDGEWLPLDEVFSDAVEMVRDCAGKDTEKHWIATTISVTPNWVEASDGVQACRYRVKVPVKTACVIEREGITHAVASGITEMQESLAWLHTRGPGGFHMSFRRHLDAFPDVSKHYSKSEDAVTLTLPKGLTAAIELAESFAKEKAESDKLQVTLTKDNVAVTGMGNSGYATTRNDCKYDGPDIDFLAPPAVLKGVIERSVDCLINGDTLLIVGGKAWRFCCALTKQEPKA